jgi:hypothetical protein
MARPGGEAGKTLPPVRRLGDRRVTNRQNAGETASNAPGPEHYGRTLRNFCTGLPIFGRQLNRHPTILGTGSGHPPPPGFRTA